MDNFNNFTFFYPYLYYFFVARYLAEHIEKNKNIIDLVIRNLHKDENAYIAIFMSHHSKNDYILEEIITNAYVLFDKYKPATLGKEELHFFGKQVGVIIKAILPKDMTPEKERARRLETQDVAEQLDEDNKDKTSQNEENDDLSMELRRGIKTVEVMGSIIRNRVGSLEKVRLESIFEYAMDVHLRILAFFFEIISHEEEQQQIIEFISNRIDKIIANDEDDRKNEGRKKRIIRRETLEKVSKTIFWNINFFVVYSIRSNPAVPYQSISR